MIKKNNIQALSGDFQHVCGKMHAQIQLYKIQACDGVRSAFFLHKDFITLLKGLCTYISIASLQKLRPLFLQLELIEIFITFNRTDVSLFKQVNEQVWKKNCPDFFIYTVFIKLEKWQCHHFLIYSQLFFPFSFVSNNTNFFIHSLNIL